MKATPPLRRYRCYGTGSLKNGDPPVITLLEVEKNKWNCHKIQMESHFCRLKSSAHELSLSLTFVLRVIGREVEECGPRLIWKWEWVWVINADFIPPWLIIQPNTKRLSSPATKKWILHCSRSLALYSKLWYYDSHLLRSWFYYVYHCQFFVSIFTLPYGGAISIFCYELSDKNCRFSIKWIGKKILAQASDDHSPWLIIQPNAKESSMDKHTVREKPWRDIVSIQNTGQQLNLLCKMDISLAREINHWMWINFHELLSIKSTHILPWNIIFLVWLFCWFRDVIPWCTFDVKNVTDNPF